MVAGAYKLFSNRLLQAEEKMYQGETFQVPCRLKIHFLLKGSIQKGVKNDDACLPLSIFLCVLLVCRCVV